MARRAIMSSSAERRETLLFPRESDLHLAGATGQGTSALAVPFRVVPDDAHVMSPWSGAGRMGKAPTGVESVSARAQLRSEVRLKLPDPVLPMPPDLVSAVGDRVVPQLMPSHGVEPGGTPPSSPFDLLPTDGEVSELARIAACEDLPRAVAFVDATAGRGIPVELLLLHLVAPAARLLKAQWEDDVRSFTEVTIGRGTLQLLVHVVGSRFPRAGASRGLVVLVAAPSEQLALNVYILEEFVRRAGWDVHVEPAMTEASLVALVASERVHMVAISVTRADALEPVARMLAAVESASLNPGIMVTLHGSAELADEAARIGAPLCADPRDVAPLLEYRVGSGGSGRRR